MTTTVIKISTLLSIYTFVIGVSTFYYGHNFDRWVHSKGDEVFHYIEFLFISSVVLVGLVRLITGLFIAKFFLLISFGSSILSFFIGFILLVSLEITGIPRHLIFIYGGCNLVIVSVFVLIYAFENRNFKRLN